MKLANVVMNKGKFVYARRIPLEIKHLYPHAKEPFFRARFRNQQLGAEQVAEHSAFQSAFMRLVADAKAGHPEAFGADGIKRYIASAWSRQEDPRTEREKFEYLKVEAEALIRSVRGLGASLNEDDGGDAMRREIVADELERTGADPLLYRAVVSPDEEPLATVADAFRMYEAETLGSAPKKSASDTFKRVKRRLEEALGPLDALPLVDLKKKHARAVRDHIAKTPKYGGGFLSAASIQREINSIKAIISTGIREHDLKGIAHNPFESLKVEGADGNRKGAQSEWELRDPLPDEVLTKVRQRVLTRTRVPELRLIWRLLQATGCRGAEITGLQVDDVVLDHETPHLWVRWNDERSIKTKTSIRPVPLLGDGLVAAKEAVEAAKGATSLFTRYAHEGGPDAVSGALMSHVRNETKDKRHVVYSLRHNVKGWLGITGAGERVENRLLGHADAGVGNRVYGGLEERLAEGKKALEAALAYSDVLVWKVP